MNKIVAINVEIVLYNNIKHTYGRVIKVYSYGE